jgi:hypothetical protein
MTDIIVVGLLLIIILILISVFAPEILFYGVFAFCIIGLVVCIVVLGAQFVHDPVGFLYNGLVVNNPIIVFTNSIMSAMPPVGGTPMPTIPTGSPLAYIMIAWEGGLVATGCYLLYKLFGPRSGKREEKNNDW